MNRKTFSLVTSLAILTSSLSPTWAAGKDFTYQNLQIKAPVDETKEVEKKIDLPLVTETLPDESVRDKYARIIFIPETSKVGRNQNYGKLRDEEGNEVSLSDIPCKIESRDVVVKGKEYYALKSARWIDAFNYKENGKEVMSVRKADNNESDLEKKNSHKFSGWKFSNKPLQYSVNTLAINLKDHSINNPVIIRSKFHSRPFFYYIGNRPKFDPDDYRLTNGSEYLDITFQVDSNGLKGNCMLKLSNTQREYAFEDAYNSDNIIYLTLRKKPGIYTFKDYKPEATSNENTSFWYWDIRNPFVPTGKEVAEDLDIGLEKNTIAFKGIFVARYIDKYLGAQEDFDFINNPIPKGCYKLKLETQEGYSLKKIPFKIYAVRGGVSLAEVTSIPRKPELIDENNVKYEGEVAWYDGYKKINNPSEFKINSDIVLTARPVKDYESEKFTAQVKEIEVNKDEDVTLEKLKKGITNLPEDIKDIEIVENVDTSKVGESKAVLKLIFSDTSSKEVVIPVKVINIIDAGIVTPVPEIKVDDIIKEEVPYNGQINLLDNIKNLSEGAEVKDLSGSIDTKRPGTYTGKVKVIFKDESSRIVEIPIEVLKALASSYTPEIKTIEVNKGEDVTLGKLKEGIVNLPKNLDKIEIKTYPDTSEVGKGKATLKLIFTDTSSKEVVIPVKVIEKISGGIITPIPKINESDIIKEEVPYNGEINLLDNINNLPDGAEVQDISDPIDTKIPGIYTGKIKITFKDGSSRIVEIPIEVLTPMAEEFPVRNPVKTQVENLENINSTEKSEIEEKVREANPQVVSIEVDDRGNVTLIYEDGSSNLIKAEDVIILREKTPEEEEPEEKPADEDNKDPEGTPGEEDEDPEVIPEEGDKDSEDKPGEVGDKDPEEKQGEKDNKDPEENPKDNEEEDNKKTENKLDSWNDFPRDYVRNHRTPTYKVETKITYKENKKQVNSKTFVINMKTGTYTTIEDGKTLERSMEVKPHIKYDRTFLPLRALADILDAKVIWNEGTRTASFTREGFTALIQIDGNKIVLSSGETTELESKPLNINGRIYLPLVNVGQVFGLTSGNSLDGEDQDIEWDDLDKTVTINIK